MGRLIDADALIENIKKQKEGNDAHCRICIDAMAEIVEEQPTAYDVEKVVEQLRCDTNCPNCSESCADARICGFEEMQKQAIEIVRKGGVE